MPRLSRLALAFLLTAVLASSSALEAALLPDLRAAEASAATHAVARLWSFLVGLWSKNGCQVNPDGLCRPGNGSTTPTAKNGCEADPNGLCRP